MTDAVEAGDKKKPPPQLLLCGSAEQRERAAFLFPNIECRYINGGDWTTIEGYDVVCFGEAVAAFAFGHALQCRVISDEIPDYLTPDTALKWARKAGRAVPYESNPVPAVAADPSLTAAGNEAHSAPHPQAESPPQGLDLPDSHEASGDAQDRDTGDSEPPAWHDIPHDTAHDLMPPSAHPTGWEGVDDWHPPVNFWAAEAAMLPTVQPAMLPPWLFDYVSDQAALRGVDPVQPALQCLLAISGAMHNSIGLRPKQGELDYVERPVLWGATVGAPSCKKDAGQAIAIAPLIPLDTEMRRETAKRMQERADDDAAYQDALLAWRKNKGVGERPPAPEPAAQDRLLCDSFTTEGLRGVLALNSRGKVLIAVPELAGLFGGLDAYGSGQNKAASKDGPLVLRLYESRSMIVDRAPPTPPVFVKSWAASIAGAIQPSILQRLVTKMHMTEDGMLARLLLVISKAGNAGEDRAVDMLALTAYRRMMQAVVALHAGSEPCYLSAGAQRVRKHLLTWIYRIAGSGALADGMAAAVGKFEGAFARLCLVMHGAECAHAGMPVIAPEVSEDTAQRVVELILSLFYPHADRFYRDLVPDSTYFRVPQLIAEFILATKAESLNVTNLYSVSAWRHIEQRQKRDTLTCLCEAGWLRKSGATRFLVNPCVHEVYAAQAGPALERRREYAARMDTKLGRVRARQAGED